MDELQKVDMGCQFVMAIWSAWELTVAHKELSFLSKEINQRMVIYAARHNIKNEPLTISKLEAYVFDEFNISDKTAKEYVKTCIEGKALLLEIDARDKRKKNIVVADELMERLIRYFSQLAAISQVHSAHVAPPESVEQEFLGELRPALRSQGEVEQ
ncbi:hypothetical protein [Ensifer sp.]|uniref:hypothetical protein n=1 Tax=Ensifer sp. TaxID=1872086 RepID=UPI002E14A27D|nr:hypothetical protein [Ensifer sp.]